METLIVAKTFGETNLPAVFPAKLPLAGAITTDRPLSITEKVTDQINAPAQQKQEPSMLTTGSPQQQKNRFRSGIGLRY